jgi:hypothetical protein
MPCKIQKNVLRFEITTKYEFEGKYRMVKPQLPIYNVETVKVLQRTQEFSRIEATSILIKLSFTLQVIEELAAVD